MKAEENDWKGHECSENMLLLVLRRFRCLRRCCLSYDPFHVKIPSTSDKTGIPAAAAVVSLEQFFFRAQPILHHHPALWFFWSSGYLFASKLSLMESSEAPRQTGCLAWSWKDDSGFLRSHWVQWYMVASPSESEKVLFWTASLQLAVSRAIVDWPSS